MNPPLRRGVHHLWHTIRSEGSPRDCAVGEVAVVIGRRLWWRRVLRVRLGEAALLVRCGVLLRDAELDQLAG
jgi:hypothetical protein